MIAAESLQEVKFNSAVTEPDVTFAPGSKLKDIERIVILETLKQKKFNRTHAARTLGIGIRTLQRKLKLYGVAEVGLKSDEVIVTKSFHSVAMDH